MRGKNLLETTWCYRHELWPFQFEIVAAGSPMKFKNDLSARKQLYQCYVDISELLFPGSKFYYIPI